MIWGSLFVPVGIVVVTVVHLAVEAKDLLSVGEVDDFLFDLAWLSIVGSYELVSAV